MSVAELKRAVDILSVEDRLELADYLRRTSKENDPQWQAWLAASQAGFARAYGDDEPDYSGAVLRETPHQ